MQLKAKMRVECLRSIDRVKMGVNDKVARRGTLLGGMMKKS